MKGKFHAFVGHKSHGAYDTEEEAAEHANRLFTGQYLDLASLNDIDYSQRTTKENRIPDELITLDFILNLTHIKDLRDIATKKRLTFKYGGPFRTQDMIGQNFDWFKMKLASLLFNVEFLGLGDSPPVTVPYKAKTKRIPQNPKNDF